MVLFYDIMTVPVLMIYDIKVPLIQHPCWGLILTVSINICQDTATTCYEFLLVRETGFGGLYGTVGHTCPTGILGERTKVVCRLLIGLTVP